MRDFRLTVFGVLIGMIGEYLFRVQFNVYAFVVLVCLIVGVFIDLKNETNTWFKMNKKQLIEVLEPFPDDMEIWIDDRGSWEGGLRLLKVESVLAWNAGLDGDEIDDEWTYMWDDVEIPSNENGEYTVIENEVENVMSKTILLLKTE